MPSANISASTSHTNSTFVENETLKYVTSNDLIMDAWKESCNAYNYRDFSSNEHKKGYLFIAFSGFHKATDFSTQSDYGECHINSNTHHFEWMNDGDVDNQKPALVRKLFLDAFLCMQQSSNLQNLVEKSRAEEKTVIFTGHSFGGPIATLWTLWALHKYPDIPRFCITFGCPLVGDRIFAKAIERKNWSPYFCHIVSRHDIVPRICFSSFKNKSISNALGHLLPYWQKSMENKSISNAEKGQLVQDGSHPLPKDDCLTFMKQVISDASQIVTSENKVLNVGPANLIGGKVRSELVHRSPYRPFGYYIFCSSSGTACCVVNRHVVLQMLYFALENNRLSGSSIMEHIEYDKQIQHIIKNSGRVTSYSRISKVDTSSEDVALELQMESTGIGNQNIQAWLALKCAQDDEQKRSKTIEEEAAKLEKMQCCMAFIEWYKTSCEGNDLHGYYDCFKKHKTEIDMKANKCRLKLAAFWDNIIELVEKEELPDDFQTSEKWVIAGTEYRLLVEPLDIAHYYVFGKHKLSGHYLPDGRPKRYRFLQKWFEDSKQNRNESEAKIRSQPTRAQDSCYWAHEEEANCSMNNEALSGE